MIKLILAAASLSLMPGKPCVMRTVCASTTYLKWCDGRYYTANASTPCGPHAQLVVVCSEVERVCQ